MARMDRGDVRIEAGTAALEGRLSMPEGANGLVVFAHGSGSGRHSPRNRFVADHLNERGLGTLLFDLLTADEESIDAQTGEYRFDIGFLSSRLTATVDWVSRRESSRPRTARTRIGIFGASTGAAAALITAADRPALVRAVVSRGGRPDLASAALARVIAPTLFIVGANDESVVDLNQRAAARMRTVHELSIVSGASHLFQEPGKLETVAELATAWFATYLRPEQPPETADYRDAASRHDRNL